MQSSWRWTVWIVQDKEMASLGERTALEPAALPLIAPMRCESVLPETGAAIIGLIAPPTLSGGAKRWNR